MIGGKVHLRKHVQVVLNLGTVGKHEAHAREDVDNLVGNDGQRVARAQLNGVGSTRQIELYVARFLGFALLAQLVDALGGQRLQLVNLHANGLLLVGCNSSEIVHQGSDLTLLAEIFQSELFYFVCVLGAQHLYFFQKFVNFVKYHLMSI